MWIMSELLYEAKTSTSHDREGCPCRIPCEEKQDASVGKHTAPSITLREKDVYLDLKPMVKMMSQAMPESPQVYFGVVILLVPVGEEPPGAPMFPS